MPQDKGIYPKYVVFKHPKFDPAVIMASAWEFSKEFSPPTRLEGVDDFCFVLKPIKDKHARIAMAAYAESVKEEKPKLAADLMEILSDF